MYIDSCLSLSEIIRAIPGFPALAARTTARSPAKYELATRGNKSIRAMPRCSGRCIVEIAINSPGFGGWYSGSSSQQSSRPKGKALSISLSPSPSFPLRGVWAASESTGKFRNPRDENASPPD